MLGHVELQVDSGQDRARQHARNQDSGERARENHEEQVISGVDGSENQNENGYEVDDSFTREAVVHLIHEPAQTGAPGECGYDDDGDPAGQTERDNSGDGGNAYAAFLRRCGGEKGDDQRRRKHQHGDAETAPPGTVAIIPKPRDESLFHFGCRRLAGYSGTRVVSMISRSIASACSDFFCVET